MRREGKVLLTNLMIHSYEFLRIILTLKKRFWGTDNKIEFPSIWSVFVASEMEKVMIVLNFSTKLKATRNSARFC